MLDRALVIPFHGPASFTGDDVVELHCHGGLVTPHAVLEALLAAGARLAEPGEFSRRALANGKLDLLQVEAIADVIHAQSEAAQRLAVAHLDGVLSAEIGRLEEELTALAALVEAAIDFAAEEHVYSISAEEIREAADPVGNGIDRLLATYDAGRLRHDGVRVAIVGPPNAGKSTLLNRLLREDRALVSEVAGTTRDWIEEGIDIGGVLYRLVDTAGLRETEDPVERMGVDRTHERATRSDVVLVVVDASEPVGLVDLVSMLPPRPLGVVFNKSDRLGGSPPEAPVGVPSLLISLSTGDGCDGLEPLIEELASSAGLRPASESTLITRARHREALQESRAALSRALRAADSGAGHELVAVDLRAALDALGAMTGGVTSEDLLARIFADFCVGK